jgi:hypothetical protein
MAFNPEKVLRNLSEYGVCVLTGHTADLVLKPVNFDVSMIIPSNICHVSKGVADAMNYCYLYDWSHRNWTITFESPPQFESYNLAILNNLPLDTWVWEGSQTLTRVWGELTQYHCKGIAKVGYATNTTVATNYSMVDANYLAHLSIVEAKKPQSNIIGVSL